MCYVFLLHSSLKIPENKRYRKWERNLVNSFELFFQTNGLFGLFYKMIVQRKYHPHPLGIVQQKETLLKKIRIWAVTKCCNWQVFVQIFDYLYKPSQQLLTQNTTKCPRMTKHLPTRTKVTEGCFILSCAKDKKINVRAQMIGLLYAIVNTSN